jgi:teichuronic acid exporter
MDDLKNKTLRGLFWSMLEKVGTQVVQFIITIFLARLLIPAEFGLIGMLSLFLAVAQTFLDSGFGAALIQKKDATRIDECSIFYFNIFVGCLFVLALYFSAPLIADFYNQPSLTSLTRFMSLNILINAFSIIQTTILTRKLQFKIQIKANMIALAVSGVIGVVMAFQGYGVWSLAIQSILNTLIRTVILWILCDWRVSFVFSINSLKGMFNFGSRLLMSNLIETFFQNLYQAFIGKFFSATSVGYFTRASSIKKIVIDTTGGTLSRVMYPSLASIQDDLSRLKRAYRKSMVLATFFHFPLMIGLIVIAKPLVNGIFSAKWDTCIPYLQLMCVSGLLYPLHVQNLEILKVKGRSDLFFKLQIIKRLLSVISIFITYRWGISALLTGDIVVSIIAYFLNSSYSGILISYSIKKQLFDILPSFVFAGLMGSGMWLTGLVLNSSDNFILLAAQTVVGMGLYFFLHWIRRSEPFRETVELAKRLPNLKTSIFNKA